MYLCVGESVVCVSVSVFLGVYVSCGYVAMCV